MTWPKKTIAVLGASGMQGSSVITQVLSHPILSAQFNVRALSRKPSSLSSKPWASSVPDQQYADSDELVTLEAAFTSAHTVFAVTDYWEHQSLERDIQQGRNIADASRAAGVNHLIWSSQYSAAQVKGEPNNAISVPALDGKAAVMDYIESTKAWQEPALHATYPIAGFYMQNLPRFMVWPQREDEKAAAAPNSSQARTKAYVWRHPWHYEHTQVPLLDVASDMGLFVAGILLREIETPGSMDGAQVHCVSEWSTAKVMVEGFARAMTDDADNTGEVDVRKQLLFVDVETEEAYSGCVPACLREGLPPFMVLFREHPLFGPTGVSTQVVHDRVLEAVGKRPTTWEEYVKKSWNRDWHG